jgi:hypothetical protein
MDSDNGNKQSLKEGFEDSPNGDVLVDDPDHIARYCAIGQAEGLQKGTDADVLWGVAMAERSSGSYQSAGSLVSTTSRRTERDARDQLMFLIFKVLQSGRCGWPME